MWCVQPLHKLSRNRLPHERGCWYLVALQAFWNMPTAQQVIPMPSTATEDWQRRQLQQHQQPPPPQTHAHAPCLTPVAPADIAAEMPKAFWNIPGAADVIPDPHARPAPATAPPVTPLLAYATAELGSAGPVAAQAPADDSDTSFEALQRRLAALKAPSAPAASNDEGDGTGWNARQSAFLVCLFFRELTSPRSCVSCP